MLSTAPAAVVEDAPGEDIDTPGHAADSGL
jgi:hypothetical protein